MSTTKSMELTGIMHVSKQEHERCPVMPDEHNDKQCWWDI